MTKKATKKETAANTGVSAANLKRIQTAFEGKDLRQVTLIINNQFPNLKTIQVRSQLEQMQAGTAFYEEVLKAVENLDGSETVGN